MISTFRGRIELILLLLILGLLGTPAKCSSTDQKSLGDIGSMYLTYRNHDWRGTDTDFPCAGSFSTNRCELRGNLVGVALKCKELPECRGFVMDGKDRGILKTTGTPEWVPNEGTQLYVLLDRNDFGFRNVVQICGCDTGALGNDEDIAGLLRACLAQPLGCAVAEASWNE